MHEYIKIYEDDLVNHVMPFWMKHSLDREHGGYLTSLSTDGQCFDPRKYMWLQGRQVWMLARLYNDYEQRPEWLEACETGVRFMRRFGRNAQGRVYFSLSRDGRPVKLQRKIFSECFYVMAMAEYHRSTGDARAREEALEVYDLIEHLIAHPEDLGIMPMAGNAPASALAIPMVMLGVLDVLDSVMDPATIAAKGATYLAMLRRHFDPERRVLREHVALEGSLADLPEGRLLNPGHSIEAAWFVLHHARRSDDRAAKQLALDVIEGSLAAGWDDEFGGIYYFVDLEGKPLPQLEWSMKLWWPHCEALYAVVAAWVETGEEKFKRWHSRLHEYCYAHLVDKQHGEWYSYLDRAGRISQEIKGGYFTGCFHVPRTLLYSVQALRAHYQVGRSVGQAAREAGDFNNREPKH